MGNQTKRAVERFVLIFLFIFTLFILVLIKIIRLQYFERDKWLSLVDQVLVNKVIYPQRGNIYDAKGAILATTVPKYFIYMDTQVKPLHNGGDTLFYRNIKDLSFHFSRIIGDVPPAEYEKKITTAFKNKKRNLKVSDKLINEIQKEQIEKIRLVKKGKYVSGISFFPIDFRVHPYENLARRTIGNLDTEKGKGLYGLESYFNEALYGKKGMGTFRKVGKRREEVIDKYPVDGSDLITTIDITMQEIVEAELKKRLIRTRADWGCCILMQTKTGEIKAIANLDKISENAYAEKLNHAVLRMEPGSTFKTISLLAALDEKKITISDLVKITKQPWRYKGIFHVDAHPKDTTFTVKNAFACSSNIAQAKIITNVFNGNAQKMIAKIKKMGILDSFTITIPGAQMPLVTIPNDSVTISKMAYGYSIEFSPLWITTIYNAIANNGKLITPVLVSQVKNKNKKDENFTTHTIKNTICDEKTLKDIKECLHDVVWDNKLGTASVSRWGTKLAQSNTVKIAGKTGTAQIFQDGKYRNDQHRLYFIGYFPEENPIYTCICVINNPQNKGAYDAGLDCGTTVRIIAEKIMAQEHHYKWKNNTKIIN